MDDELIGYDGAEAITGLTRGSLRSRVHRHLIPHVRISSRTVRFRRSDLQAWLAARAVEPASSKVQARG